MNLSEVWNSICTWGPAALLPIFNLLGTDYLHKAISSHIIEGHYDTFTRIAFTFPHAVASIKVGQGVKSEGELIISGTKGYVYVPAPWWKTDYFEIRFENPTENKRYFYQLDGEGIRYELVTFIRVISSGKSIQNVDDKKSLAIVRIMEDYFNGKDLIKI
jgi:choline-phosphate cytidylyltransferase